MAGSASGDGAADRHERIISGSVADPAAWPSIGALYFRSRGGGGKEYLTCGATVIAPRYALTAAHCVEGTRPSRLALVVGRPDLADESVGQRIPVAEIGIHPGFRPPYYRADLAVLTLRRDAPVAATALPSRAQGEAATFPGAPVRLAGWGVTKASGGGRPSRLLMTTPESVLDSQPCARDYGRAYSSVFQICVRGVQAAEGGRTGACYGDSGGPLIADTATGPLLVGVVSGGGGRCASAPEFFARVSAGLGFIRKASGVVPATP